MYYVCTMSVCAYACTIMYVGPRLSRLDGAGERKEREHVCEWIRRCVCGRVRSGRTTLRHGSLDQRHGIVSFIVRATKATSFPHLPSSPHPPSQDLKHILAEIYVICIHSLIHHRHYRKKSKSNILSPCTLTHTHTHTVLFPVFFSHYSPRNSGSSHSFVSPKRFTLSMATRHSLY